MRDLSGNCRGHQVRKWGCAASGVHVRIGVCCQSASVPRGSCSAQSLQMAAGVHADKLELKMDAPSGSTVAGGYFSVGSNGGAKGFRTAASEHTCTRDRQRTEQGSDAAGSGARVSFAEDVGRLCCCELHTHTLEKKAETTAASRTCGWEGAQHRHILNSTGGELAVHGCFHTDNLVRKWP